MRTSTPMNRDMFDADEAVSTSSWVPSRAAGLERLSRFLPRAGRLYQKNRNEDYGRETHPHVSGLSPYLRHRLISDEEVLSAVLECHDLSSASKFIDEIFWRSYFKGWLEHHPNVWLQYNVDQRALHQQIRTDSNLRRRYLAAINGGSGISVFDDWVGELRDTGYLHNHSRMWFASIWTFTLKLPWQLGTRWYHYHLLDGDIASNTLSWRWVAGLHTRGKTYLARPENIQRYGSRRLPSQDGLQALAKVAVALQEPPEIAARVVPSWPDQTPSIGRTGLLLHDEDLGMDHPSSELVAAGVLAPKRTIRQNASKKVARFGLEASLDTLNRLNSISRLDTEPRLIRNPQAVQRWAEELRLDTLLVPYAPIGDLNAALAALISASSGVKVVPYRRRLDCLAWPHARAGYFGLKKKIPDIIDRLLMPN